MGRKAEPVVVVGDSDLEDNGGQYKLTGKYAVKVLGDDAQDVLGGTPMTVYPVSDAQVASGQFEIIEGHRIEVAQVSGRGRSSSKWAVPVYSINNWPS